MASLHTGVDLQNNSTRTYNCAACLEDIPFATVKPCTITIHGEKNLVCAPCLRSQFLSAQESETSYPVKWQTQILHPRAFPLTFDRHFITAYEAKEKEYLTPALQRVYCECGAFVAPMVTPDAEPSWRSMGSSKLCSSCKARWCLRCAQRCHGFGLRHRCEPERRMGERRLALGGLKKGEDWQVCPREGCGTIIELVEACNSMVCICGTAFCFICGKEAKEGSDHWMEGQEGRCPKWGFPGSGTELFDFVADEEDDGLREVVLPWERGQGEPTVFDFHRWAWGAAMLNPIVYEAQMRILHREGTIAQRGADLLYIEKAMHEYNSASHSGIDKAGWEALVSLHKVQQRGNLFDGHEEPLINLLNQLDTEGGLGRANIDLGWLESPPERIFNVAVTADRDTGAQWVKRASIMALAAKVHEEMHGVNVHPSLLEDPGIAVFDVGPGAAEGESWRIRDMEMFEDVPGLEFWKLGGNALLVMPGDGNGHPDEHIARAAARVEPANVEAGGQPGDVLRPGDLLVFGNMVPEDTAMEDTVMAEPEEGELHIPGALELRRPADTDEAPTMLVGKFLLHVALFGAFIHLLGHVFGTD